MTTALAGRSGCAPRASTSPCRYRGPWADCYFQAADPSGVIVQFIEWVTPPGPENT
ncbi:hypothetical protein AB0C13_40565 [Streptomyces sp. NPDC049099]|uniref:hypothetical protein n=1 Tax=Streptomyces sp. NPDC049099 TaxID=3155768 RepID=UPI00341B54F2